MAEDYEADRGEWLQRVLKLVLPRVRRLPDFVEQAGRFCSEASNTIPKRSAST